MGDGLRDAMRPAHEQLPRQFSIALVGEGDGVSAYVDARWGLPRRISAGAEDWWPGDGYRWYLVWSLAFAAVLGWSPILRALIGVKRRSDRSLEKGDDGVRAQMLEEYVISVICLHIGQSGPFTSTSIVPEVLLEEIRRATDGLEVADVADSEWRIALAVGAASWLEAQRHKGGIFEVDLREKSLRHRKLDAYPPSLGDDEIVSRTRTVKAPPSAERLVRDDLPGAFEIDIVETKRGVVELFVELAGGGVTNVGSKAEEWSRDRDLGFRWHDIFHLANLAILGWSPVSRALLGIVRSGNERHEDALRAQTVEEMIIARVYASLAVSAPADLELVAQWAVGLTAPFEVGCVSPKAWVNVFESGRSALTYLSDRGRGRVRIDTRTGQFDVT